MKVRPLRGFVLVEIDPDPYQSAGGIILGWTDERSERPKVLRGTVLAVGPGDWLKRGEGRKPMDAKVGMRVCVDRKHCWAELQNREPAKPLKEVIIVHDSQIQAAEC